MTEYHHTIIRPEGSPITVTIRRDNRLKKSSRWVQQPDESILIRVPRRLPKRHFPELLADVAKQLDKRKKRNTRRTDSDLQKRAQDINRKYFKGKIQWDAIRWVSNMNTRLGSCTRGGPTDGHIRISDKIQSWPKWVVDYVIAHELTHRLHPNHSETFWEMLRNAFPLAEKAEGFIQGVGFSKGIEWEED